MPAKQIESYDTHLANSIKSLFLPTPLEVGFYLLCAAVVLSALNYQIILNGVSNTSEVSQDALSTYLHDKLTGLGDFGGKLFQGRIATMLFWAFIGSLIYMAVWTIQNLIINLRNDVKASEFVTLEDRTNRRRAYWNSVISSKIFFVCSLLTLGIYVVGLLKFFFPLTSKAFGLAINSFHFPSSLVSIFLVEVSMTLLLFILVLLVRVVVRAWRWIIGNF